MTHAKRMMHLAIRAAAPGHPAGWRLPGGERQANEDVAHYQNVARICERALLDVLFDHRHHASMDLVERFVPADLLWPEPRGPVRRSGQCSRLAPCTNSAL